MAERKYRPQVTISEALNKTVYKGTYIEIDMFRFTKGENEALVTVEMENDGEYEYLDEFYESKIKSINDLIRVSYDWITNHVTVKEG